jgi:hypothetical protein
MQFSDCVIPLYWHFPRKYRSLGAAIRSKDLTCQRKAHGKFAAIFRTVKRYLKENNPASFDEERNLM